MRECVRMCISIPPPLWTEQGDVDKALALDESGRRYHSMALKTSPYDSDTIVASKRAGFQTDV